MPKLDSGEMCAHHMESGMLPGPLPSEPHDATATLPTVEGQSSGKWLCMYLPGFWTVGSSLHQATLPQLPSTAPAPGLGLWMAGCPRSSSVHAWLPGGRG